MLLALDVGFSHTGWSLWDKGSFVKCGVIETTKSSRKSARVADDNAERAAKIARELRTLVDEFFVQGIIGELPTSGGQSARAISHMAMATACVATVAAMLDLPVEWTTPDEVKKAMTGMKGASKNEMMAEAVRRIPGATCTKDKRATWFDIPGSGRFCAGVFEHAADSVGVYFALQDGLLVRTFG